MNEEIRDIFCGLYDKDMLEKLCMQFQDRVPSLSEIVTGAEGIEASQISTARPAEATVATVSTYKKNSKLDQKKTAKQRTEPSLQCYMCDGVYILVGTVENQTVIKVICAKPVLSSTTTNRNVSRNAQLRRQLLIRHRLAQQMRYRMRNSTDTYCRCPATMS